MGSTSTEHTCVFGLSWGDEGKGKVVDLLCPAFDIIVRFNGGANAGHTVCVGEEKFALHLLPAGALHAHASAVIGPGVVVDPITLLDEIDGLAKRGIDVSPRLKISDRAHLVLAYHKLEDRLSEQAASAGSKIGTTARGIGPCYADKMKRTTAVRMVDLLDRDALTDRLRRIHATRLATLSATYGHDLKQEPDVDEMISAILVARQRLLPMICDTVGFLHDAMDAGRAILFEGANGMLLDVDHGTYPYVTSSSTGPHGIGPGAGVSPMRVSRVIGTAKAYATRVGSGPFISELDNEIGDLIRQRGKEFGTTTGRPRRCGWFDAVSCRYSVRLSGTTDIAMTHLDTLSGFDRVGLCVGYRLDGKAVTTPPADAASLERIEPVFEYVPGWRENLRGLSSFEELPEAARSYIDRVETLVGASVSVVGVGPERSQMLVRGSIGQLIGRLEPSAT